jgi:MFS family permease
MPAEAIGLERWHDAVADKRRISPLIGDGVVSEAAPPEALLVHSSAYGVSSMTGARGALIGAIAGGVLLAGGTYLAMGRRCDDTDAHISCGYAYTALFVVGAAPGAIIGYLVGRRR